MKKTITVSAYNRPGLLSQMLASLKGQMHPLDDYTLRIRIDAGGSHFEEVLRVASGVDFMEVDVYSPNKHDGCIRNTYKLMLRVFEGARVDWNVYLEDDFLLSPDTFNLVEWYIAHSEELKGVEGVEDIGAYCLCRLRETGPPDGIYLSRAFVGWGFLMDAHQWETYAKPAWCHAKELWGYERMWDNSIADYIRTCGEAVHNAFPELSRITNTGVTGTHFTAKKYAEMMANHKYNQERKVYDFRLVI